jgi:flagellar protein FliO/FliZ
MPTDLNNIIYYIIAFIFVIALILIGARLLRGTMNNGNSKAPGFLRGREKRLGVVEAASVDGRRRLILLRRDDVEHLIMTGGPVDVVIETGIHSSPNIEPRFDSPKDDGQVIIARDTQPAATDDEKDSEDS